MVLWSRLYCLQMHSFCPLWILFLLIFWSDLFLMFCLPCLSVSIPNTILGKNRDMLDILKPFSRYSLHSCGRSRRRRIWQGKKFLCWTWGNRKMKTCSTRLFPASRTLCLPAQSWQMKLPDFWWCLAWRIKDLEVSFPETLLYEQHWSVPGFANKWLLTGNVSPANSSPVLGSLSLGIWWR